MWPPFFTSRSHNPKFGRSWLGNDEAVKMRAIIASAGPQRRTWALHDVARLLFIRGSHLSHPEDRISIRAGNQLRRERILILPACRRMLQLPLSAHPDP